MKEIARMPVLSKEIIRYAARHSFANVLQRCGDQDEVIST
jgi:hypothetical protein